MSHRRRRRRRVARSSALAVDLRAHSVTQVAGPLNSLSAHTLRSAAGEASIHSWSRYLDLELQQPHFSQGFEDDDTAAGAAHSERGHEFVVDHDRHDLMFDQDLGLDVSHQGADASRTPFDRARDVDDVDDVHLEDEDQDLNTHAGSVLDWHYNSLNSYPSSSYQEPYDGLDSYELTNGESLRGAASNSASRATRVAHGQRTPAPPECPHCCEYRKCMFPWLIAKHAHVTC